jgi:hypothetical protein
MSKDERLEQSETSAGSDLERELGLERESHETTKRMLADLQTKIEEAEARCCPEDVGFEEWIGVLQKRLSTATSATPAISEDARDAARYRWLRTHSIFANDSLRELWFDKDNKAHPETFTELDREIDRLMNSSDRADDVSEVEQRRIDNAVDGDCA